MCSYSSCRPFLQRRLRTIIKQAPILIGHPRTHTHIYIIPRRGGVGNESYQEHDSKQDQLQFATPGNRLPIKRRRQRRRQSAQVDGYGWGATECVSERPRLRPILRRVATVCANPVSRCNIDRAIVCRRALTTPKKDNSRPTQWKTIAIMMTTKNSLLIQYTLIIIHTIAAYGGDIFLTLQIEMIDTRRRY